MTKKPQKRSNNYSKTVITQPGGLASIKPSKLNHVIHNPKGGIAAAMNQPNFIKRRRKAKDGHEVLEIDYT